MTKHAIEDNFLLKARVGQFMEWFNLLDEPQVEKLLGEFDKFRDSIRPFDKN